MLRKFLTIQKKKIPDYTENTFAALDTVCARLRQKGEVAMCGDSNARTGTIPDYVTSCNAGALHDIYQEIGLPVDSEEPRNNSGLRPNYSRATLSTLY